MTERDFHELIISRKIVAVKLSGGELELRFLLHHDYSLKIYRNNLRVKSTSGNCFPILRFLLSWLEPVSNKKL